jgi:hypothetical protein
MFLRHFQYMRAHKGPYTDASIKENDILGIIGSLKNGGQIRVDNFPGEVQILSTMPGGSMALNTLELSEAKELGRFLLQVK